MSNVYYARVGEKEDIATLSDKTIALLRKIDPLSELKKDDLVGIKTHFGDKGNIGHIDAGIIGRIAEYLGKKTSRIFATDTNTLYLGPRCNSVDHLRLAYEHNFSIAGIKVPVIIADGLTGRNFVEVKVPGKCLRSVKIASDIASTDYLVVTSHMTGHMQTGFGAAIKNLGMGCASRAGKLEQHSNVLPEVSAVKCDGCGVCLKWCPADAISVEGSKASIVTYKCIGCGECTVVCRKGAIAIKWSEEMRKLQEKMAEYGLGVLNLIGRKNMCFINFLTRITKDCDCMSTNEPPICPDIGILASCDPVAIDKASVDLITAANKKDIFKIGYPDIDWSWQLNHGEKIGLGSLKYKIEEVKVGWPPG